MHYREALGLKHLSFFSRSSNAESHQSIAVVYRNGSSHLDCLAFHIGLEVYINFEIRRILGKGVKRQVYLKTRRLNNIHAAKISWR